MQNASQNQPPLIELTGVGKYYSDGDVHALRDVHLTVFDRQFVSIVGPSGCGKSTLLHVLGGLDRPTRGDVVFRGAPMYQGDLDKLRSQEIGFVFQSFYLLPNLTAVENVQLPMFESPLPLARRIEEAHRLLGLVGMQHRLNHLPNQLSVGQRQRVAIARALANGPAIVLADEPTGSLDSSSGQEVMDLLSQLNEQHHTTLVVVTHDPLVAQRANRTVRMLDGRIVGEH